MQCVIEHAALHVDILALLKNLADSANTPLDPRFGECLVGCGEGKDAKRFTGAERVEWRNQALVWLKEELALLVDRLEVGDIQKDELRKILQSGQDDWKFTRQLACVRDPVSLAKLPEEERRDWMAFWQSVDTLLEKLK